MAHISLSQSVTEGSQGRDSSRNLEMGAAQETTEEGCLLARSLWRGRFALLDTQDPLARVVPPKVGQALSPQSSVRKMSRSLAYLSRTRAFFSLESPSSQMVPACVKLTGKSAQVIELMSHTSLKDAGRCYACPYNLSGEAEARGLVSVPARPVW